MATTLRGSHTNSATTGTNATVTITASVGDVVIVSVHFNGQTTIVDNNGATPWTEDINDYKPNPTGGHTLSIFSRRFQTGDPTSLSFTGGASGRWSVIAHVWQNPNASAIYDVAPSTTNAANTDDNASGSIDAPTITTTTANAIHVVHGYWDTAATGTISTPSGYTNIAQVHNEPQASSYKVITSAGATGAQTYSNTEVGSRIALSYAIKDIGTTANIVVSWRSMRGIGQ